jgi:hypothetical protein
MITLYQISVTAIAGAIIGIVAIARGLGLPSKWAPVVGVVLGIGAMLGVSYFETTATIIFTGIVIGLSSLGLYDFSKKGVEIVSGIMPKK